MRGAGLTSLELSLPMNSVSFLTASLALIATSAPAFSQGTTTYDFIDLGTLGGDQSVAYGLNDAGQVVGWSTIPGCVTGNGAPCRRAFLWDNGVMTDLGLLAGDEESFARAINNSGQIVGTSEANILFGSGTFHAVTWDKSGIAPLMDLGAGLSSFAYDINDAGQITGWTTDPNDNRDSAVVWAGGSIANIGMNETHESSRAQGISNNGKLAGFAWNLFSPNDSILYDGTWLQIGGAGQFQNSEASDVNDQGTVVGLQAFPSGGWHGAYWPAGAKDAIDAGVLPGLALGELYDVNEWDVAVGRSYADDGSNLSRAMLFDGNALYDLNDFLPAVTDAVLYEAREINENGDIVGTAVVGGKFRAFMMKPMPDWKHIGTGLAGALGEPVLDGFGTMISGDATEVRLSNAPAGAPFYVIAGYSQIDAPFLGGVFIPSLDYIFPVLIADGKGAASLPFSWPKNIPAGFTTYWQAWVVDATGPQGVTATQGLTNVTQ